MGKTKRASTLLVEETEVTTYSNSHKDTGLDMHVTSSWDL